jgi:hypothetical protein
MGWIRDEIGRAVGLPREIGGIPLDEFGATDRLDPLDAPRGALRRGLLGVARHKARKRDDAAIGGHTDMRCIDGSISVCRLRQPGSWFKARWARIRARRARLAEAVNR